MLAAARCRGRRPCLCTRAHAAVRGWEGCWRTVARRIAHRAKRVWPTSCWRLLAACSCHIAADCRIRMRVRDPRHRGRVQLGVRACAQRHEAATPVMLMSLEDVCGAGGAVQEGRRAVGEVRSGELAATEERAVLCAVRPCCRAARFRSPPRAERLWASSWGSATQHGAGCGVQVRRVGSRGSLEPGAMEQRALRMPSPLLLRRERVVVGRGHGQRTRERRWRGSARAAARAGKHAPIWLCARKERRPEERRFWC